MTVLDIYRVMCVFCLVREFIAHDATLTPPVSNPDPAHTPPSFPPLGDIEATTHPTFSPFALLPPTPHSHPHDEAFIR